MISLGTLRNWRMMKIGPSFLKLGRAVLYPLSELEAWDRKNLVICRAAKVLSEKEREAAGRSRIVKINRLQSPAPTESTIQ